MREFSLLNVLKCNKYFKSIMFHVCSMINSSQLMPKTNYSEYEVLKTFLRFLFMNDSEKN